MTIPKSISYDMVTSIIIAWFDDMEYGNDVHVANALDFMFQADPDSTKQALLDFMDNKTSQTTRDFYETMKDSKVAKESDMFCTLFDKLDN